MLCHCALINRGIYRSESERNNVKGKYTVSCCLTGKFWIVILTLFYINVCYLVIMFYMSVIYFSFIKHLVIKQTIEQTERSKEVIVWFTQML